MFIRTGLLIFFLSVSCLVSGLVAQQSTGQQKRPTAFWPRGEKWDKSITTPQQFFGFDVGRRHLRHDQVANYLKKLATETDRITIQQYGRTHGHRPLLLLTITAKSNHNNINRIRVQHPA